MVLAIHAWGQGGYWMGRIVFLAAILMWTAFLSNNRNVMAVVQLLLVGASVQMLISALHPHRKGTPALKEGKELQQ